MLAQGGADCRRVNRVKAKGEAGRQISLSLLLFLGPSSKQPSACPQESPQEEGLLACLEEKVGGCAVLILTPASSNRNIICLGETAEGFAER